VLNRYDGPSRSNATALVSIFIVDAGISGVPAFAEKSVSPRVSEIAMIPNCPLRMRPAIDVMSDISDATVRGAVELTAGTFGAFFALAAAAFLAAALRLAAAEVVVFFFVLVWDGRGAAATDARRITARIRSFRYSIDLS
jgi:hypothetical protein